MAVCVSNMASLSGCQVLRVRAEVVEERSFVGRSRSVRSLRGKATLGGSLSGRVAALEGSSLSRRRTVEVNSPKVVAAASGKQSEDSQPPPPEAAKPIKQTLNLLLRLDATGNNLPRALWSSDRRGYSRMQCNALPANAVEGDEEEGTPWEGAVMFRRSATQSRFDYATTLERLGLARFSSERAISVATDMGLTSDGVAGTPVQISIEVTKQGRDFQVDGVIRTALALVCNQCLAPAAERIYASFNLLLTEALVKEPTQRNLGVVLGEDVYIWRAEANEKAEPELDIDLDDRLHFPRDQKELDLSKYLRDTIHLEIPAISLCVSNCAGLCIGCGVNLNNSACRCGKKKKAQNAMDMEENLGMNRRTDIWGPLEQLKKQLEEQQ